MDWTNNEYEDNDCHLEEEDKIKCDRHKRFEWPLEKIKKMVQLRTFGGDFPPHRSMKTCTSIIIKNLITNVRKILFNLWARIT